MPTLKPPKSLAEQLAELENPRPIDTDPEALDDAFSHLKDSQDSGSSGEENEFDGREHYQAVGESKLRQHEAPELGPRYVGAKVTRDAALDVASRSSEDDPFARRASGGSDDDDDSNDEKEHGGELPTFEDVEGLTDEDDLEDLNGDDDATDDEAEGPEEETTGLGLPSERARRDLSDGAESADDSDDDGSLERAGFDGIDYGSSSSASYGDGAGPRKRKRDDDAVDRAALRELMVNEQRTVVATLTEAAKADAAKGRAVKWQRVAFDALLNTRIRMQKALVAVNSFAPDRAAPDASDSGNVVEAAEAAALKLLNSLHNLRSALDGSPTVAPTAAPRPFTLATSSAAIHAAHASFAAAQRAHRRAVLARWDAKTAPPDAGAVHGRHGSVMPAKPPLVAALDAQLAPAARGKLVARAQLPRSCAPLQAAAQAAGRGAPTPDPAVFDDADWYALLLRDLIDARGSSGGGGSGGGGALRVDAQEAAAASAAARRTRARPVGPQASKGRRMRYHVHERLQNFAARATEPGPAWWAEGRARELFAGLLGRRVRGGLGEDAAGSGSGSEEGDIGEKGLRLFRGQAT